MDELIKIKSESRGRSFRDEESMFRARRGTWRDEEEWGDRTETHHGRNKVDSNLGSIKLTILFFQGKGDPELYLEWEKKDQLVSNRRRNGEGKIHSWAEVKRIKRKRFVPSHCYRELYNKLQSLVQGGKNVEEYYQEMEIVLIRANIEEDREATMARFLHGLNKDITNLVELQDYVEMEDMLHMAIKIEWQLKQKSYGHISSQCPNKRTLALKGGELVYASEEDSGAESDEDSMPELEDCYSDGGAKQKGHSGADDESQRDNIFHTRCLVRKTSCVLIIDNGSCTNVASTMMVDRLKLPTTKHPKPYTLQWLNDLGGIKVTKQVRVAFGVQKFQDEVLCDVIPMQACHLLLGRPWLFDRDVIYKGRSNCYCLTLYNKLYTLTPLSPKIINEDQHTMKLKEFEGVFFDKIPSGLPPIRGIEYQIDFVPGSIIPNRLAYRANLEETKELQRQVEELLNKGYVRESLSPCVVPVILVPKKDGRFVVVYFDDILIYSRSYDEHVKHVRLVLETLRKEVLFANLKKHFVKDFSTIAAPLNELVKKDVKFNWGEAQQSAFDLLKQKLISSPIISLPNFDKTFEIDCDTSGIGFEQIKDLYHDDSNFSQVYKACEQVKEAHEGGLMGHFGVQKIYMYCMITFIGLA
eukprot:XP_025012066.1 uncharacterized protein LOC112533816 [Ricinus communis]